MRKRTQYEKAPRSSPYSFTYERNTKSGARREYTITTLNFKHPFYAKPEKPVQDESDDDAVTAELHSQQCTQENRKNQMIAADCGPSYHYHLSENVLEDTHRVVCPRGDENAWQNFEEQPEAELVVVRTTVRMYRIRKTPGTSTPSHTGAERDDKSQFETQPSEAGEPDSQRHDGAAFTFNAHSTQHAEKDHPPCPNAGDQYDTSQRNPATSPDQGWNSPYATSFGGCADDPTNGTGAYYQSTDTRDTREREEQQFGSTSHGMGSQKRSTKRRRSNFDGNDDFFFGRRRRLLR